MTISITTAVSSLLPSKPLPPPPVATPNLLSLPAQQLQLPKATYSKKTPSSLARSHSIQQKSTAATSRSTNIYPTTSFSSLTNSSGPGVVDSLIIACPSLAYASTLYFKSGFNVQINLEDNEPEDSILFRFRRAVMKARILQECKRRRFFESTQDKKRRKTREAARKNRKRYPQPRTQTKHEAPKKKEKKDDDEDDNWELPEGDIPYC